MGAPVAIQLDRVSKRFGELQAVYPLSLRIEAGQFFSLLGPSGCGKTTLLRMIAGFEQPDSGHIYFGDQEVTFWPPQKRPTAMVFQHYALFPHMTVYENVAYGLKIKGVPHTVRRERVQKMLERVGMHAVADKPVHQLSGGQQQRVALARALAVSPQIVLFDEPLSNLDVALREQTRRELKLLQRHLGMTAIYVTHDQQEALALSDYMGVMREGRLVQVGTPQELYTKPETAFVAQFLGGSNVIREPRLLTRWFSEQQIPAGKALSVRPEHWAVSSVPQEGMLPARLLSTQFLGAYMEWWIEAEGKRLRLWQFNEVSPAETLFLKPLRYRWVVDDNPSNS